MRTGAIFARGSCRALKWLALMAVVFALGTGPAAAQVTYSELGNIAEGAAGQITVTVPVAITADLTGADTDGLTFTLGVSLGDGPTTGTNAVGTAYGAVTQRETGDVTIVGLDPAGPVLTFTLPAVDGSANAVLRSVEATLNLSAAPGDPDAEDEAFTVEWGAFTSVPSGVFSQDLDDDNDTTYDTALADPAADVDMVVVINDDETVVFALTEDDDGDAKEGTDAIELTLKAGTSTDSDDNPFAETSLGVSVGHEGDLKADYTLSPTAATTFNATTQSVAVTLTHDDGNDGNRNPDTITVTAYSGTVGNRDPVPGDAIEEVVIADIHTLPSSSAITVMAYDGMEADAEMVDSVAAGSTVYLQVEVDRGADGYPSGEALEVALSLSDSSLGTLGALTVDVPHGTDKVKAAGDRVSLMVNASNMIAPTALQVNLTATGADDTNNGPSGAGVAGAPLVLTITQPMGKKITAKSDAALETAVDAAMAEISAHGFNPGESFDLDPEMLFELSSDAITAGYVIHLSEATSDAPSIVSAGTINGMARLEATDLGEVIVIITARAMMGSSSAAPTGNPQTLLDEASINVPLTVVAGLASPGVPQNLTAMAGDGEVTLSWEAPSDGGAVASYQYDMNASGTWMDAGTGLTKTVTGLTNNTQYVFRVRAVNADGAAGEPTAGRSATPMADPEPLARPGVPQNLEAAPGNGEVTLSWEAPSDGGAVASYQYDMNADGDAMDAGTGLTKTVTGLTNGNTYVFRVRAKNTAGESGWTETVTAMPTSTSVDDPVTVKSVSTSATSVAESGGLTVTVVANVPAGTKGADGKVAPIASKAVTVSFPISSTEIKTGEGAEDADTTVLGDSTGDLVWTKITRTEKASEQTYKFRVAINQDLDAEDEKFQVEVSIDGASKKSKVVTVTDAEDQEYELSLPAAAKGKIKEGAAAVKLSLTAKPSRTMPIEVTLALNPNDPSKYTLGATKGTLPVGGTFSTTIAAKADKNREEDTVTVAAYMAGTLGNDEMLDELEIPVTDINALPAVKATLVDDDGDALDPQPESVTEGETVKVMLTAVDKDGKAMKAAEKLTIMLAPAGTADSADYRLTPNSIEIAKDKESSTAVDLMATNNDDIGAETLMFDAIVSGEAKNGTEKKSVMGVLSLMIEDATAKQVYAKPQEEVEAAIYAAKNKAVGDDMTFAVGDDPIEIMGSALFSGAEGVSLSYTAASDNNGVAATAVRDGMVTVTAAGEGMAHITITAHANCPSGVKIADQTDPCSASVMFPVEVGLVALSLTLTGPEDMNVAEGMGAMVTVTANRAVTVDTTVNLMRDRAMSTAIDMDFEAEPIVIEAGEMTGSTMVMAVEDNMAEDMEELVLYGMAADNAGEVMGEVKLYLWDAAVPALPVIAQLLLAAFLAVGGYRRYRRR